MPKKISAYKKRKIRARMAEIRRQLASIYRVARFMGFEQLKPYEKMADEYAELEAKLKAGVE